MLRGSYYLGILGGAIIPNPRLLRPVVVFAGFGGFGSGLADEDWLYTYKFRVWGLGFN